MQSDGFAVVVADNSGTFAEPGIESFDTGGNLGFGVACNLAVARLAATVGTVGFHNPDLDVTAPGLDRLCLALGDQSRPGVVAPAEMQNGVLRSDGYRYPSAGRELALAARAVVRGPAPVVTENGRGPEDGRHRMRRRTVGRGRRFGGGGLWVVDRAAFEDVGGFDASYFLYAEDLDLWHRFGLAGRSTGFCPDVRVVHQPSTGSPMGAASREILRWLGVERFEEKYGRPGGWERMRRAHRALLPAYRRRSPELAGWVGRQWQDRLTPEHAQHELRRRLEGRRAGNPV